MRIFFIQCFKDLHALTGLKQYIEISTHPDGADYAQRLLDELIGPMLEASKDFGYIPQEKQQEIIRRGMATTDRQYFYHLDQYWIRKWLQAKAGLYFKEIAHEPTKPGNESNAKALFYDELSEDTKLKVDELLRALQSDNAGFKRVPEVTQKEIDSIKLEDLESQEGKRASGYIPNPELAILHEKKIQWIRETHDPVSGKAFEGTLSFEEWVATDK